MTTKKNRRLKIEYKYRVDICWSPEDDAYVVKIPELAGCVTHGETLEQAISNTKEAIAGYIDSLKTRGLPIPKPLADQKFSGKIPLRIDPLLHRDLAVRAQIEGASLNRYIEGTLKKASGQ